MKIVAKILYETKLIFRQYFIKSILETLKCEKKYSQLNRLIRILQTMNDDNDISWKFSTIKLKIDINSMENERNEQKMKHLT